MYLKMEHYCTEPGCGERSGHGMVLARVPQESGQCSQRQGLILGQSHVEPGAGVDDP